MGSNIWWVILIQVSQLANRSVLIDTAMDTLSVAHKVFPRSITEKVKVEEIYVEKLLPPFFCSVYFLNLYLCTYLILFNVFI